MYVYPIEKNFHSSTENKWKSKIQHEGSKTHPDEENGEAILQMVTLEEGLSRLKKIRRLYLQRNGRSQGTKRTY